MKKIIILISLALLLLLIGIAVYSQQPPPTPPKSSGNQQAESATKKQRPQKDHNISTTMIPKIDVNIGTAKAKQNKKDGTDQGNNETPRDWWTVIPTIVIAIFAVIQGLAMIFQYRVMRQQTRELQRSIDVAKEAAEAAKKSAEAVPLAERAHLFIDVPKPVDILPRPAITSFNMSIRLSNFGKTAAFLIFFHSAYIWGAKCPSVCPETSNHIPMGGSIVGPSNAKIIDGINVQLPTEEYRKIINGEIMLFYCGKIAYQDVWNVRHELGFCWEWNRVAEGFNLSESPINNYT